jgi:Zn-dependent protease
VVREAPGTLLAVDDYRGYEPIHPRGFDWRRFLRAIWAPVAALIGVAVKFGFVFVKFFSIFISVAAYALLGGWQWGVGIVVLIFVHEMGHWLEARRQGLEASWPTFIPFIGAYVLIRHAGLPPWRNALISLAGPFLGGIGAAVCWAIGEAQSSQLFMTLAYTGFLLNLFNLIPIGFLDGGAVARAALEAWRMPVIQFEGGIPMRALQPDRSRAVAIWLLYLGLVAVLAYGLWQTHVPQTRL